MGMDFVSMENASAILDLKEWTVVRNIDAKMTAIRMESALRKTNVTAGKVLEDSSVRS
eukprot:CAMPEP_0170521974 /NCGR_PEP_ID=MMETSP0209-20121228/7411_1 /TAXON_ID=665100 ORGANISM="Litonotus pictus, Strain P1" /NCGR_SAMPLE_ID=MMETSP0209 /ASSEMBLY_ACC=CAM_ASM_000301 /LENGTH=57 /DNA_ID=CAMNT_0010809217 /DNA_START=2809 /DNA_END=2982 /DNA_ORIENTATION=-